MLLLYNMTTDEIKDDNLCAFFLFCFQYGFYFHFLIFNRKLWGRFIYIFVCILLLSGLPVLLHLSFLLKKKSFPADEKKKNGFYFLILHFRYAELAVFNRTILNITNITNAIIWAWANTIYTRFVTVRSASDENI